MVFKSNKQRKAVMARLNGIKVFSYITGKRLPGTFKTERQAIAQLPKREKIAFRKVIAFRRKTGRQDVDTLKDIKRISGKRISKRPVTRIGIWSG